MKALGDHSSRIGEIAPGTRVVVEGPFGTFTEATRRRAKVLLVAGGIGITPVRALLEEMHGDIVVLYRVITEEEIVFSEELGLARTARGASFTTSSATMRPRRVPRCSRPSISAAPSLTSTSATSSSAVRPG